MIFKLGGNSGSGKSTFVRALLDLWKFEPEVWEGKKKIKQYVARVKTGQPLSTKLQRVVVLGDYSNPCGGMDGVSAQKDRVDMLRPYLDDKRTLCICEGVLFGSTFGEIGALGNLAKSAFIYAFMSTPLDVCLQRINLRRTERGTETELNPARTIRRQGEMERLEARVRIEKKLVYVVDYKLKPKMAAERMCSWFVKDVR